MSEGEAAGCELRPSLTLPCRATQRKDRGLRVSDPSAGPTGPELKLVSSAEKFLEAILSLGPTGLGPTPTY